MATTSRPDTTYGYQYQLLNPHSREIRLLKIHAGSSGPTEAEISTYKLEAAPNYLALSYTWGPSKPTYDILLDGKPFGVRRNLYGFLHEFRKTEQQFIWIDQICIDQFNNEERNYQVSLMSSIYTSCSSVIIWLCASKQTSMAAYYWTYEHHFGTLVQLLRDRYFRRLWVVQEILLAPNIRVLVEGGYCLSWTDMLNTMRERMTIKNDKNVSLPDSIVSLFHNEDKSPSGKYELWYCLDKYSGNDCTDPRDRVFGLLSLVAEGQRVRVDYNKSLGEVFADTVRVIMPQIPRIIERRDRPRIYWTMLQNLSRNLGVKFQVREDLWKFIKYTSEEKLRVRKALSKGS